MAQPETDTRAGLVREMDALRKRIKIASGAPNAPFLRELGDALERARDQIVEDGNHQWRKEYAALSAEYHERMYKDMERIEQLEGYRIPELERRQRQLEAALREWGAHHAGCRGIPCSCGLAQALAGVSPAPAAAGGERVPITEITAMGTPSTRFIADSIADAAPPTTTAPGEDEVREMIAAYRSSFGNMATGRDYDQTTADLIERTWAALKEAQEFEHTVDSVFADRDAALARAEKAEAALEHTRHWRSKAYNELFEEYEAALARAASCEQAPREPTQEMVDAAVVRYPTAYSLAELYRDGWRAMYDAALASAGQEKERG